jgi:hypothetical protein
MLYGFYATVARDYTDALESLEMLESEEHCSNLIYP